MVILFFERRICSLARDARLWGAGVGESGDRAKVTTFDS